MAFSSLYGRIVELCFNVWPNNVRLNHIRLDWQSKFGNTNVPLQTPIELSNHRAEIYAL